MRKKIVLLAAVLMFTGTLNANLPEDDLVLDFGNIENLSEEDWKRLETDDEDGLAVLEEDIDEEEDVFLQVEKTG